MSWVKYMAIAVAWCGLPLDGFGAKARFGWIELVGTNVVLLGTYPNTEDRTAAVTVRNGGEASLRIERVVTTCKCMRVVSFPQMLGPGESGEVAVLIAKHEVAGTFEHVFFIESDGLDNRRIKIRIVGYARPLFLVTCDVKNMLGPVDPESVWTGRYTVVATETGIRLGEPTVQNRGARCEFSVRTNQQAELSYAVTQVVTFEGEGLLESAVVFPILREDGQKSPPVRLLAEAVCRRSVRLVPDRLVVAPSAAPVHRRMLLSVDSPVPLDAGRLEWEVPPEGVEVKATLSTSGKAFFVDVTFSPASLARLASAGGGKLTITYGNGLTVETPIQVGR